MAAISSQLAPTNNTDANFRAWMSAMHSQMIAGGLIQTNDSGQIDTDTALRPTVTNTSVGYKMYRSNDAGGGLTEFYLKIEYGSGAGHASTTAVWVTLGWATDGAGTITGMSSNRFQVGNLAGTVGAHSTTLYWSNMSVAPGRAQIAMFTGEGTFANTSVGWCFSIERLRNASFQQTNNILFLAYRPQTGSVMAFNSQVLTPSLAYPAVSFTSTANGYNPLQAAIIQADAVQSGAAGVSLQFGQMGGVTAPSANIFGGATTSFGAAQTNNIKITTFGVERNYILNGFTPYFNSAGNLIVMRFE